jgi:hypothetical protein
MAHEPRKKITVTEESSLDKLLTEASVKPILLEKNGEVFLLERMENEETLSPDAVAQSKDGILKAAGSWKNIDTEAFKGYMYLISRGSWQLSGSSLIPRCAKEVDQRFQH